MGLLDFFRRPRSLVAAEVAAPGTAPPTEGEAVPGGANMSGRVMFEFSVELRDAAGYGRAGTYEVGQWQQIALSNPYVTMAMDHVLRPIADARVDIEPVPESVIGSGPGRITQADADMHAAFLEWALTERFQLSRLSKVAAAGFLLSGFALFEPLAEETLCPAVPGRTVFALRDAQQCLPNSLDPSQPWPVDERGRLVGIRQFGPVGMGGKWVRTLLPAERALLFPWKREAGNFAGVSQLRSCWYIAGKVMPVLMKMIGVTLQKEGPGVPQAVATDKDAKLTPLQRDDLIKLYANMVAHESAGMVMPAGWKTEWAFSPVSNKGHILQVIERMGLWILQQFGAQQLVIGTGEVGSRSAGETHDARSMAMVREVLGFEADVYNGVRGEADGLCKRLIEWNWGPQPAYPKVKLTPQRPEMSPKELADAFGAAKNAGLVTVTLADQNSFRDKAGLAPIDEATLADAASSAQDNALNGAQVTAATDLMQRVADGMLPYEAALEALVTFFNVAPDRAERLMSTLKTFKPEPKATPGGPAPEPDADEQGGPPDADEDDAKSPLKASSKEPERDVWNSMWARCSNSDNKDYARYGGRGIKVCKRWESYESFIKDMGRRPSDSHSIDRIDNDGNYEPSNCRWATAKTQRGNRGDSLKASAQRAPWQPWRALRASEQKTNFPGIDAYFTKRRDDFEAKARPVVLAMLGAAAPALERAMADGKVTPDEVAAVPLDDKRLDAIIRGFLAETRGAGATFVRGELERRPLVGAAEDEQDDQRAAEVMTEADDVVDAEAERLRKRMLNRLRGEIEREAVDTMRTGGTASEVVTRTIARQLDTGAFKADAGSVTTRVFNVGRDEAAKLVGGVESVEYSAVLDSATCEPCQAMDGKTAAFDSPEHDAMLPPNRDCQGGDNCRCLLMFVPAKPGEGDE